MSEHVPHAKRPESGQQASWHGQIQDHLQAPGAVLALVANIVTVLTVVLSMPLHVSIAPTIIIAATIVSIALCAAVILRKRPVASVHGVESYLLPTYGRRTKIAAVVLVCVMLICDVAYTARFFRQQPLAQGVLIAIAPFEGPDQERYGVSRIIAEQLRIESGSRFTDVQIIELRDAVADDGTSAELFHLNFRPTILVWGRYVTNNNRTFIIMKVKLTPQPRTVAGATFDIVRNDPSGDLRDFTLQTELSQELGSAAFLISGIAAERSGRYAEAIDRLNVMLQRDRRLIVSPELGYYFRAVAYLNLNKFAPALRDVDQSLGIARTPAAQRVRARIYLAMERFHLSLRDYESVAQQYRSDSSYYFDRGFVRELVGDLRPALNDFNHALALKPEDPIQIIEARAGVEVALAMGPAAVADYTTTISIYRRASNLYEARGMASFIGGDNAAAFADLNTAIDLGKGRFPTYYVSRAQIELRLGQYALAIADCNHAMTILPGYVDALKLRGFAELARHDYKAAIVDLTRVQRVRPRDVKAIEFRALALDQTGHLHDSVVELGRAISIDPRIPELYKNRSIVEAKLGMKALSLADARRAQGLRGNVMAVERSYIFYRPVGSTMRQDFSSLIR